MKIAIYGAGKCGEYVLRDIQTNMNAKISCTMFIDNKQEFNGKQKYGIPIINLDDFINLYSQKVSGVLIAASNLQVAQEMVLSLLKHKFTDIFLLPEKALDGKLPIINMSGEFMSYIKSFKFCKPVLPYIEYHVSDFCNLKCKGCGHFSNRISKKQTADLNEFKKSLIGLKKRFKSIEKIRLMGGEPFVNNDLWQFIYETRSFFPYADIRIATNGLLLPNISDVVIKAIKECSIVVDITQYPPTRKIIEKIINFVDKNEIRICLGEEKTQFVKRVCKDINYDVNKAWENCINQNCHFLRGKYLYPCPAVILRYENKDILEINITKEIVDANSFDLINGEENGWEILNTFSEAFDFCMYCSTETERFEWSTSGTTIKKEDWIVGANMNY